jgi:hypothetical protein
MFMSMNSFERGKRGCGFFKCQAAICDGFTGLATGTGGMVADSEKSAAAAVKATAKDHFNLALKYAT